MYFHNHPQNTSTPQQKLFTYFELSQELKIALEEKREGWKCSNQTPVVLAMSFSVPTSKTVKVYWSENSFFGLTSLIWPKLRDLTTLAQPKTIKEFRLAWNYRMIISRLQFLFNKHVCNPFRTHVLIGALQFFFGCRLIGILLSVIHSHSDDRFRRSLKRHDSDRFCYLKPATFQPDIYISRKTEVTMEHLPANQLRGGRPTHFIFHVGMDFYKDIYKFLKR